VARELVALDSTVASVTAGHADVPIMASHPVYDYFARRYHLNIKSVLWEPGAYPGDGAWLKLGEVLQEHQARWMIWEGPPLAESVERLERMGMRSVVFDPCGNRPDQGDFMTVMRENADRLRQVWQATD
jgi:zinc transport system substrate-binding protein